MGIIRTLFIFASATAITAIALPPQQPLKSDVHSASSSRLPLLTWHGLGDGYDSDGMNLVGELLNQTHGPTYTYNIRLDEDGSDDRTATFYGNVTEQIAIACAKIAEDPILSKAPAVNAIGFSQGGQFMRGYVETCNIPPVKKLVTFGSPHNGISDFNNCEQSWSTLVCIAWDGILKTQTWTHWVQSHLVPAQYYKDPEKIDEYLEYSNWLANVNNERPVKNETYKKNLANLDSFWMYQFSEDTVVVPPESTWFDSVVGTGEDRIVKKLKDQDIYQEDWIGLKELDEKGALVYKMAEGPHMSVTDELLKDVFEMMYD